MGVIIMSALGEQDGQGAGAWPAPVPRSIAAISLSDPLEAKLTAAARADTTAQAPRTQPVRMAAQLHQAATAGPDGG